MAGIVYAGVLLAEAHDRAFAELFLDLADGHFDGLETLAVVPIFCWGHTVTLLT